MRFSYRSSAGIVPFTRTFPLEILHLIIGELWYEPQSPQDRAQLAKGICLTSHTWLCLYTRIALRDNHLPLSLSANRLLHLLPAVGTPTQEKNRGLFTEAASQVANYMCQSLTFHVDARVPETAQDCSPAPAAIKYFSSVDPAANAVASVLSTVALRGPECLPNLRHVAIKYTDWAFETFFDLIGTHPLPPQVTHLSVDFEFGEDAAPALAMYLSATFMREGQPALDMPGVRHLAVKGMPAAVISDLLDRVPNLETLEIGAGARFDQLGDLPDGVHTLVLNHSGEVLRSVVMDQWELDMALALGLAEPGSGFRIVVRSSTPNPFSFSRLKRFCRWYGVEFVYERVDKVQKW